MDGRMNWILDNSILFYTVSFGLLYYYFYAMVALFVRLLCHTYFSKVDIYGMNHLPREGPVIVCPNHPNMLVDALLVLSELVQMGRSPYVWVKASLYKNPIVAKLCDLAGCVPVFRPVKKGSHNDVDSDKSESELKLENEKMFQRTWDVLNKGDTMVLFPEGTSYTKSHMIELKTGVMRVATGFVEKYDMPVTIIPCGLTYFRKDRFRSEVVVEFGNGMVIDQDIVRGEYYLENQRGCVKELTKQLETKMHRVTLNAPDAESIHMAKMYRKLICTGKQPLSAQQEIRVTRNIVSVLNHNDFTPIQEKLQLYSDQISKLHVTDHYVQYCQDDGPTLQMMLERILYLLVLVPLGCPGFILNCPFYLLGKRLNTLASYTESKSMFKIFAAAFLVPAQWIIIVLLTAWLFGSMYAKLMTILLPMLLYSHIRVLEEGRRTVGSVQSLVNIKLKKETVATLRELRSNLVESIKEFSSIHLDPAILSLIQKTKTAKHQKLSIHSRQTSRSQIAL